MAARRHLPASDASGLPRAFIDCGSAERFGDEDVPDAPAGSSAWSERDRWKHQYAGRVHEGVQMQELVARLTAVDPEAGETLKVVSYFDTLVGAAAGLDALLRGAAVLSGVVAGVERRGRVSRRGPDGQEPDAEPGPRSPQRAWSAGAV